MGVLRWLKSVPGRFDDDFAGMVERGEALPRNDVQLFDGFEELATQFTPPHGIPAVTLEPVSTSGLDVADDSSSYYQEVSRHLAGVEADDFYRNNT